MKTLLNIFLSISNEFWFSLFCQGLKNAPETQTTIFEQLSNHYPGLEKAMFLV